MRCACSRERARVPPQAKYSLSSDQAEGVLGMTLRRLVKLEANKLREEQQQLSAK